MASGATHIISLIMSAFNSGKSYNNNNSRQGEESYISGLKAGSAIGDIGRSIIDIVYGLRTDILNLNRELLQSQVSIVQTNLELMNKTIETSMGTISGGFEQNANRVIMQQGKKLMELAKANVSAEYSRKYAMQQMAVAQQGIAVKYGQIASKMTEALNGFIISSAGAGVSTMLDTKLGSSLFNSIITFGAGELGGSLLGSQFGLAGEIGGSLLGSGLAVKFNEKLTEMSQSITGFSTGALNSINSMVFDIQRQEMSYQLEVSRYNLELMKQGQEIAKQYIDSAQKMIEPWVDLSNKIMEEAGKFDTAIRQFVTTTGYIGDQADLYVKSQLAMSEGLATLFGKGYKEMMEVTKSYQDAAGGRQVNMSREAYETQFSTGRLFGMADSEVAGLYGGMNIFNTSIESAGVHMEKMYKTITKMGLSTSKFGRDLNENLKKAQKYNFSGGVENMMKLTQWAQQTRFNLDAATGFSDKILGGTLSNAIETSAKLQVLGGAAAIYSDPLGMIYDAGGDVGALAKRQAAMFSDLSGTFNSNTGETEFSWYENYMIKQRAAAAGMSEEDAKNMIRQQNKQGVINRVLSGYDIDENTKTAIGNRATYNQKTKQWEVTDIKGETHNIQEYVNGNLNIGDLLPENNDDAMLEIAKKSLGFEEEQTNFQAALTKKFAYGHYEQIRSESNKNLETMKGLYSDERVDGLIGKTITNINEITRSHLEAQSKMLLDETSGIYDNYFAAVKRNIVPSTEELNNLTTAMTKWAQSNESLYEWVLEGFKNQQVEIQDVVDNTLATFSKTTTDMYNMVKKLINGGEIDTIIADKWVKRDYMTMHAAKKEINGGKNDTHGITLVSDGIGNTNGGFITNTSKVKSIEDGSGVVGTSKYDQFLVAKAGGPIDKLFNGVIGGINDINEHINGGSGTGKTNITVNVVVSGNLDIRGNGSYDIINELKTDNTFATNMASILSRQITGAISENSEKSRFNWGSV